MRQTTQEDDAMQLDIRGRRLTPALLDHVERRVRGAVRRLASAPSRVAVQLDETPATGKRCRIEIELPGGASTIEEVGSDLFAAIDRATAGIGRATERFRAA
jgi:ribosome-associated translation inhibitor RaiA